MVLLALALPPSVMPALSAPSDSPWAPGELRGGTDSALPSATNDDAGQALEDSDLVTDNLSPVANARAMWRRLHQQHMLPTAEAYANDAVKLEASIEEACRAPSEASDEIVLTHFRDAVLSGVTRDAVRLSTNATPVNPMTRNSLAALDSVLAGDGAGSVAAWSDIERRQRCPLALSKAKDIAHEASATVEAVRGAIETRNSSEADDDTAALAEGLAVVEALGAGLRRLSSDLAANGAQAKSRGKTASAVATLMDDTWKATFIARVEALRRVYDLCALEQRLPSDTFWMKNLAGKIWRNLEFADGLGERQRGAPKDVNVSQSELIRALAELSDLIVVDMAPLAGLKR